MFKGSLNLFLVIVLPIMVFQKKQLKFFKILFWVILMFVFLCIMNMIVELDSYLFLPTTSWSWIIFSFYFFFLILLVLFSIIFYRVSTRAYQNQPEILEGVITQHHSKIEILREKQHLQNSLPKALHQPKHSRL